MKHTIFFMLACTGLLFCNSPAPKVPQNLNCYVRFLEQENRYRAEASLTETRTPGGSVAVEIPGGIRYDGKEMRLLPVKGMTYFIDEAGTYAPEQAFTWSNAEGAAQKFAMSIGRLNGFGFAEKTIDRSRPGIFSWEGEPLEKGEALVFLWENIETGNNVSMDIYGNNPMTQIEFPASKLSTMSPGKWSLYVVRRKMVKSDVGGMAVSGVIEFYSRTDTLLLK